MNSKSFNSVDYIQSDTILIRLLHNLSKKLCNSNYNNNDPIQYYMFEDNKECTAQNIQ